MEWLNAATTPTLRSCLLEEVLHCLREELRGSSDYGHSIIVNAREDWSWSEWRGEFEVPDRDIVRR